MQVSRRIWLESTHPTGPFTSLELQDQEIDEFHIAQERRKADFEAPKSQKGRPGGREKIDSLEMFSKRLPNALIISRNNCFDKMVWPNFWV